MTVRNSNGCCPALWRETRPGRSTCRCLRWVHQMIGTPEGYEAWTGIAIGYEAIPASARQTWREAVAAA
jgi:hypothetical protein